MAAPSSPTTGHDAHAGPSDPAGKHVEAKTPLTFTKDASFWLSFTALVTASFLSAIDLTSVSTALPRITHDLRGGSAYSWVGSAYSLAATAVLPLAGRLADIFGRRPVMLVSIAIFALGSAVSGGARNMGMLIAGRSAFLTRLRLPAIDSDP